MSCETWQQQAGLLIDAELREPDQVALFRHLEDCSDCRLFLDSAIRFRKAMKKDREEILLAAEELPTVEKILGAGGAGGWLRVLAGRWRFPAPVAVGLAIVLLVAGALFGARISRGPGGADTEWRAERTAKPAVVVVCGLPEVEVYGTDSRRRSGGDPQ